MKKLKIILLIGVVSLMTGCIKDLSFNKVETKQITVEVPNLLNQDKFKSKEEKEGIIN